MTGGNDQGPCWKRLLEPEMKSITKTKVVILDIYIKGMLHESQLTTASVRRELQNVVLAESNSEKKHGGAYSQSAKYARRGFHVVFLFV